MENNNNFYCVSSLIFLFAGVYQNIVLLVDRMCEKDSEGSDRRSRKRDMFENLKIRYHHFFLLLFSSFLQCEQPSLWHATGVFAPREWASPHTECRDPSQPKIAVFPSLHCLTIRIPCTKTSQRLQLPTARNWATFNVIWIIVPFAHSSYSLRHHLRAFLHSSPPFIRADQTDMLRLTE